MMNTTASTIPEPKSSHPRVEGSFEKPYIKDDNATPYITEPGQSNLSPAASAHSVLIFVFISISERIPNGIRNANMLLHPKYCVSNPPITGPSERPR